MSQIISRASFVKLLAAGGMALLLCSAPSAGQPRQAAPPATGGSTAAAGTRIPPDLELKRYQLEKRRADIEDRKADIEEEKARWTALSILVPVVLGFATLYWQARTAYKLKEIEWELKAAEVVLNSKSTKAGEERLRALRMLFPHRIDQKFTEAFDENAFKLPGMAYQEKKLELFKAMSANPEKSKEIFRLYAMFYADEDLVFTEFADKWRNAYPEDRAWVDEFSNRWKQAYPKGKWEKQTPPQKPGKPEAKG